MSPEMGEYVVGAVLRLIENCDVVDYNVRPPGGGMAGLGELGELDALGLRFADSTAFLCDVATHLRGFEYGTGYEGSIRKVSEKPARRRACADSHLKPFSRRRYMFWCPIVPKGRLLEGLLAIEGLEIITNREYSNSVSGNLVRRAPRT